MDAAERLEAIAAALSIGRAKRHIFLCAEQKTPKCAPYEETAMKSISSGIVICRIRSVMKVMAPLSTTTSSGTSSP